MNWESWKQLFWVILLVKVILKKRVHKIILYFSHCTDILRGLSILIIFYHENLKDYLMKILHLLLNLSLNYLGTKLRVRFSGTCLKQESITYTHRKIVNIYIVYETNKNDKITSSDPTLENCLFGAVRFTYKFWCWQIQIFWIWNWIW